MCLLLKAMTRAQYQYSEYFAGYFQFPMPKVDDVSLEYTLFKTSVPPMEISRKKKGGKK